MTPLSFPDLASFCLFLAGGICGWVVRAVYAEERKIESPGREDAVNVSPGPVPKLEGGARD